jgi:hypothetical protein
VKILCTHPGKYGDSLWALPTVRAIAEAHETPIDLLLSPGYSSHAGLLRAQDYIGDVRVWERWQVQNTAPMTPWSPFEDTLHHEALDVPEGYDVIVHLGYRAWPRQVLPVEVYQTVQREYLGLALAPLDLKTPWIRAFYDPHALARLVVVAFSEQHFELKYGLAMLLQQRFGRMLNISTGPRHSAEADMPAHNWVVSAGFLRCAEVALCCCSASHVLACAVGTPVVMMEPDPDRHNDIFYPYGKVGPEVTLVLGGDGKPTFDARHVGDAIAEKLK